MLRLVAIVLTLAVAASAAFVMLRDGADTICTSDEVLQARSGHAVQLCEIVFEVQPSNDTWAVVRVVDPALGNGAPRADHEDHDWACETWGLPALDRDARPSRIIVQIMESPFVRGEPAQGITQSIEAYSEENAACMWELL